MMGGGRLDLRWNEGLRACVRLTAVESIYRKTGFFASINSVGLWDHG